MSKKLRAIPDADTYVKLARQDFENFGLRTLDPDWDRRLRLYHESGVPPITAVIRLLDEVSFFEN